MVVAFGMLVEIEAIQVASIPKGSLEWSVNVGSETFYEIVIELKDR